MRCPYKFPARSRKAMIDAMESIGGYGGWNAPYRASYPFAWNVKYPYLPDADSAKTLEPFRQGEGEPFNPQWDDAWQAEMESGYFFDSLIESVRYGVEDYSTWPGDDDGAYEFAFGGRSGGWLILESAHGQSLRGLDLDELRDAEESGWSVADVRRLYRAVMTMDSDFSRAKVADAFRYELASRRAEWEQERRDEIAELKAKAESNKATAVALLGELRATVAPPVIYQTIRKAIHNAIRDRRDAKRKVAALTADAGRNG